MMHKRSYVELRKLRKQVEIYEKTLANITAACATKSISSVEKQIEKCDVRLEQIDEREDFLRKLEDPTRDPEADAILKEIRERNHGKS
jgi:lipopolysaccharide biosynthesis regulator YciM